MAMTKTKAVGLFSSSLGISIGCIMGMVPLLFIEDDWTKEMREVFSKLDTDGNGCDQCLVETRAIRTRFNKLSVGFYPCCSRRIHHDCLRYQGVGELRVGATVPDARRTRSCWRSSAGVRSQR